MRTLLLAVLFLIPSTALAQSSPLYAPRVMYWWGKVNQHFDVASGTWMSDPDGTSGADIDMLAYCQHWYPGTRRVVPYARETISTWRAAGGVGAYTATETSYWCMP